MRVRARSALVCLCTCCGLLQLRLLLRDVPSHRARGLPVGAIDPAFHYNRELSDALGADRAIPDVRPLGCAAREASAMSTALPVTSVVIVENNEAHSTLLRTVTSVHRRSPARLVHEILIVDDFSDWEVDAAVRAVPKVPLPPHSPAAPTCSPPQHRGSGHPQRYSSSVQVAVLRLPQREGLIRARMTGVRATTAPTITFLDSHVECNVGWLPPLLERVGANSTTVISPVIDVIDALTFRRVDPPPMVVAVAVVMVMVVVVVAVVIGGGGGGD